MWGISFHSVRVRSQSQWTSFKVPLHLSSSKSYLSRYQLLIYDKSLLMAIVDKLEGSSPWNPGHITSISVLFLIIWKLNNNLGFLFLYAPEHFDFSPTPDADEEQYNNWLTSRTTNEINHTHSVVHDLITVCWTNYLDVSRILHLYDEGYNDCASTLLSPLGC
jgi:hypothetical protein